MKKIMLTGDRPTGRLHLGHFVGSLKKRVEIQNSGEYELNILIADLQAFTDNFMNPAKVRENILEVALDYLAVGIDPMKTTICIQSLIPALHELPMYYANLVTLSRLQRNPTVKSELKQKGMDKSIPTGFLTYPISQAADITAFNADIVPVGVDQLPMIEQTNEIVNSFNNIYKGNLKTVKAILPDNKLCYRLVGIDGNAKMSKSLNNGIYLSDTDDEIRKKVMSMYTDPNHIRVEDKGMVEGNVVFTYLDVFCNDEHFIKYLNDYKNLDELKDHYKRGGLGDIVIKKFLTSILVELITPIRTRRLEYEKNIDKIYSILEEGTKRAIEKTNEVLKGIRQCIGNNYFDNKQLINDYLNKDN